MDVAGSSSLGLPLLAPREGRRRSRVWCSTFAPGGGNESARGFDARAGPDDAGGISDTTGMAMCAFLRLGGGHGPDEDVPGDDALPAPPDDAPPVLGGLQPVFVDAIVEEVVFSLTADNLCLRSEPNITADADPGDHEYS